MKRCVRCAREIPQSATTCGHCDNVSAAPVLSKQWEAAAPIARASAPPAVAIAVATAATMTPATATPAIATPATGTPAIATPVIAPAAPAAARGSNRRMLLAALLVVAGGTLTFAMLRSSAPPARPMTAPAATPKPAAVNPAAVTPAPTKPVAAAAGVPVVPSKWNAANREWLLNARKGVAFELPALKKVAIWQALSQPMLVVRCDAGRMQTFVYTSSALQMEAEDENHRVRISFDDEPEVIERWPDSSDHDALFAPDAVAFARRVTTARTLRFGYTPHNARSAVAEFQVTGLSDLIEPAAKQCGWKK